jgi:hypothetical protein
MVHAKVLILSLIVAMPATLAAADAVDCEGAFLIMNQAEMGNGRALYGNSCGSDMTILSPTTTRISVNWFHDAADVEGLTVKLDGEGQDASGAIADFHVVLPVAERRYVRMAEGVSVRTAYWSDAYDLPDGFQGFLTATLLQNGVAYAPATQAQALTPLAPICGAFACGGLPLP